MNITHTLAKTEDGTVQIIFTIPWTLIETSKSEAVNELAKEVEVPGFRKGKAPIEQAKGKISESAIIEKLLAKILPKALADSVSEYKLKPAIYPKLELVSAKDKENWQVKATTCELPNIELGDYKTVIRGAGNASKLWTPDKGKPEVGKEQTLSEKENLVVKTLLETIKIKIPKLLVEEEVNARLANLLARIEKLGLSLENYLASIGKTPETIREDYKKQASDGIALELILNQIVDLEGLKVPEKEIDEALKATGGESTEDRRRVIRSVLGRKAALDSLIALI